MRCVRAGAVAMLLALLAGAAAAAPERLIYLVLWRGCEESCRAFKEYVAASGMNARIEQRDVDKNKSRLPGFVREARALDAELVVTWGTSVTRGMVGTLKDKDDPRFLNERPVVFMVVADPIGAGIIESYERTGRANVTGTRNRVPEAVNINVIRSYQPHFRRLGMLYNANERNSVIKVEEMRALGAQMGFEVVAVAFDLSTDGAPSPQAIPAKVAQLREQVVDFVYVGSSSFLRNNQDVFTDAAAQQGLPVLSPYESMVRDSHALLSISARYTDVGRIAGEQAQRILVRRAVPGDLPVVAVEQFAYVINMDTAHRINLVPPLEVLEIAETVH